VDMNEIDSVSA